MNGNQTGPREQALRDMRETEGIPDFLDRTKGMTKEEIAASGKRLAAARRASYAAGSVPTAVMLCHAKTTLPTLTK